MHAHHHAWPAPATPSGACRPQRSLALRSQAISTVPCVKALRSVRHDVAIAGTIKLLHGPPVLPGQSSLIGAVRSMSAMPGGFNWSTQHSSLLSRMECGHETATSHLLLGSPTV